MIPILYDNKETSFNNNGIGLLTDAISCEVTEERNGSYELIFTYPITGQFYNDISEDFLIKAKPNEKSEPQLFRIYKSSKPINGIVTYNGEHISYELNGNPTPGLTVPNNTPLVSLTNLLDTAIFAHKFSSYSNIQTRATININEPCSVRSILGGKEGSILDVYGGEYEFDNYVVLLHAERGSQTDIVIEYGKNLTDIKQEKNISEVYTALFPYARYTPEGEDEQEQKITLPENVIILPSSQNYGHVRTAIVDISDMFDKDTEAFTIPNLRLKANQYIQKHSLDTPNINITASFVQLWQTKEYEAIAPLERVSLCDTVKVRFPKLGVDVKAKVIKTVYDTLREKYITVELGNAKSNFSETIKKQEIKLSNLSKEVKRQSSEAGLRLEAAIKNATELITGQKGGYVVLNPPERPQEILIMDSPDITTAQKVWRWNSAGLGYSSTGYTGTFGLAMTMDGAIVADYITSGVLDGALIKAGTVSAESISQSFKTVISEEIEDGISVIKSAIEQDFIAADNLLLSKITTIEDGITTAQTAIQQTKSDISLKVSKTSSYETATRNSAYPTNANTTAEQKTRLYFCTANEKYYYWNEITQAWVVTDSQSIYSAFIQTASGFKLSNNVSVDGSLVVSGTIDAARISTEIAQVNKSLNIGDASSKDTKFLKFNNGCSISSYVDYAGSNPPTGMQISATSLNLSSVSYLTGNWNFSQATVSGLSNYATSGHTHDYVPITHHNSSYRHNLYTKPYYSSNLCYVDASGSDIIFRNSSGGTITQTSNYATSGHSHSGYATTSHTHSNYASSSHTHSNYATYRGTHSTCTQPYYSSNFCYVDTDGSAITFRNSSGTIIKTIW